MQKTSAQWVAPVGPGAGAALGVALVAFALTANAQIARAPFPGSGPQVEPYPVRMVAGSGDLGMCTMEVSVDGVAEVEMKGTDARLRTVSGARAMWRKAECTAAQPLMPVEFRFNPLEGRGRQFLMRAPQENNGVTLIRIEDESGGSGNYKFELTWRIGGPAPKDGSVRMTSNVPPGGPGGIVPGPPVQGWNDSINFRGTGEGYLRTFHGGDSLLVDAAVSIDPRGRVHVELVTSQKDRLILEGRLINVEKNRLSADMSGSGIGGTMEILLDSRSRVEELALTGVGRGRSELRWTAAK